MITYEYTKMRKEKVMKIRKILCYLLSVMLLACIPWSASFAAADTTDPVDVRSGESITVGNINVANNDYAAQVRAESPEGNMDASLKAASVSLKNGEGNGTALIAESYIGLASADITGDITANAQNTGQVDGVSSSRSNIKVGGNVTTEIAGQDTWTNSVIAWGGNITVGKDVIAKGFHAGAINVYDESDEPSEKTTIIVNGGVSAQGEDVKGLNVWGGLSDITIKKSVAATSTDNSDYYWARGIDLAGSTGMASIDVSGDVTAKAANGNAAGVALSKFREGHRADNPMQGTIQIHGNVISDSIGILSDVCEEGGPTDILVEETIKGKDAGVLFSYFGDPQDIGAIPFNVDLTTWKIDVNKKGNVAEVYYGWYPGADAEEDSKTAAKDFEKQIKYIVKVEQPSQGGTLSAVDVNGKALPKSFNFPVAHEGEKIILKADLKSGWTIKAAYNGKGADKKKLSKDENGNFYLIVPKGGGVYLSADLKKKTTPVKPTTKVSGMLIAKMLTSGETGVTVTWTKLKGVKGYDVFFCRCDGKEDNSALKKVATVKAGKKRTWSKTGLKQHRAYKAIVKAYVYKKGKKKYVRTSPLVHAYSSGSTKRYTNASGVTVNKTELTLNKKGTFQIKGKAIKNNKKKIMNTGHSPYLRYLSSNKKIATVSKSGKITAKSKGECYVYTLAHNGIFKKIKVTVK